MDEVDLLLEIKKLRAERDERVKNREPTYEVQAKLNELERQRATLGAEKLLDRKRVSTRAPSEGETTTMNATAMVQDQEQEIATLRERVEALRPKLDEARREAEGARAAFIAGDTSDVEAANAQSRLNALQGAYEEVTSRLSERESRKRREAAERLAEAPALPQRVS